jgi:hypothetical protein
LTGDGVVDRAYFEGDPRKLIVVIGENNRRVVVGSDNTFDGVAEDLSWVDYWGITHDRTTGQVVVVDGEVSGGKSIALRNSSIVLRRGEEGGGVVTFRDGWFNWIHQSD